jgi:hypothetical protein
MSYQTKPDYTPGKKLTLSKSGGSAPLGKFDKKPEHPNKTAGIFVNVAINNVFGGMSLADIQTVASDSQAMAQCFKVVDAIVDHQIASVKKVEPLL